MISKVIHVIQCFMYTDTKNGCINHCKSHLYIRSKLPKKTKFNIKVVAEFVSVAHIKCTHFKSSNHTMCTQWISNIFGRLFKCTPLCLLTSKSNLFIDRANKRIDLNFTRTWIHVDTRSTHYFRIQADGSNPTFWTEPSNRCMWWNILRNAWFPSQFKFHQNRHLKWQGQWKRQWLCDCNFHFVFVKMNMRMPLILILLKCLWNRNK